MPELAPDRHDERFDLTDDFLRAIIRWENAPHNRTGEDKSWVEQLIADTRDHYRRAVRIR